MADRDDYELFELVTIDKIEFDLAEPPSSPDESVFVILGETTGGEKIAISIPFAELDDILNAITATTKQFPQGQHTQ